MIYLLRHGDAEDAAADDASRRLTKRGERQAEAAGKALAQLGTEVDACLASPKVRARDTAQIACRVLGLEVEIEEALRGGGFDPLELAAGRDDVLIVGHQPDLSNAVAALTGASIKMRKGGVAAFEPNVLHALLTPRQLREIANR